MPRGSRHIVRALAMAAVPVLAPAFAAAPPAPPAVAQDGPTSLNGNVFDVRIDEVVTGSIGAKSRTGAPLRYAIGVRPIHGTVTIPDPGADRFIYTPARGRVGSDRFGITATDGRGTTQTKVIVNTNYAATHRTWYVDAATGNDGNDGASETRAFATIAAAHAVTRPGDTVLIKNGTYTERGNEGVVHITRSGAPGAMITYKAFPGHRPVLTAKTAWNHVLITASYIRVEGLEIAGNAANVDIADSNRVYERFLKPETRTWGPETSFVNTNGIGIRPPNQNDPLFDRITPRFIEIVDNHIHHVPGGGIATDQADHILIANNRVHDTAYRSIFANSGISIFHPQDTGADTGTYKNIVIGNIAWRNRVEVKWFQFQRLSDGNGIIVDDTMNRQIKGSPYNGRTLVANNIVFENGGAGIQAFSSTNVDIFHNTAWHNTTTPELDWGQILARTSINIRILNNIIVAADGERVNEDDRNQAVTYDHNIYFGGRKPDAMGPNDCIIDPMLVAPGRKDFALQPGSPAIDSGYPLKSVTTDILGRTRPLGAGPDIGAFETKPRQATP
ncbi:choice-of-anchor Q domain-containing protein [Sandaracinobacteroides saxicola]|uniref:Right-handed parallel beta-helix repeat-containing protein n=1 Tax=Sandaracinobacteroides saxicola TaxID=2759707 RepID=A0A7G5IM58_9SPHN|nr:choice-of-anchor Q domain-containing protein [Sandaracinobacteroides saxicola]QMW24450.1 right-handed parallel beta-helix repeat-containing protein [Sandaracinobacteroides saxicola]